MLVQGTPLHQWGLKYEIQIIRKMLGEFIYNALTEI